MCLLTKLWLRATTGEWRLTSDQCQMSIAEYCIVQSAFCNLHNGIMLYDAVYHAYLQSAIRDLYPIRIRGIVENDIRMIVSI